MTDHAISGSQAGYRRQGRQRRFATTSALWDDDVGIATPADIAVDMQNHRTAYQKFLRSMTVGGLVSALVLGALLLLIY